MSRLGKNPIAIPNGVEAKIEGKTFSVKGPKGSLQRDFSGLVTITVENGAALVVPKKSDLASRAMWGTVASHIRNMIAGVITPFEKKMELEGVGYRAEVKGKDLVMALGFSHPVNFPIPEGITVTVEKGSISVSGINKEQVGQFAATVRAKKRVEPYKGKGIRYEGEFVRRKQGKKAA